MAKCNGPCVAGNGSPAQLETQHSAEFEDTSQSDGVAVPQPAAAVAGYSSSPTESMGKSRSLQHTGSALKLDQALEKSVVVLKDIDAKPLDCDGSAVHTAFRTPEVLGVSTCAAQTGLTSGQDEVTQLPLQVEAQGIQVGRSMLHDTADASVQVDEACSAPTAQRSSAPRKCFQSCRQNGGHVMPHDTAGECCRQDASLQTQLANATHQPSYTTDSTASQTDAAEVEPSAFRESPDSQHDCAKILDRHARVEKSCIPVWERSVPRDVAVGAPDPGVLLAVQGIRAQLEALNHEMVSVMLHPLGASRMKPNGNASAAQAEACGENHTDSGTDHGVAAAELNERQPRLEWTFKPAAEHESSQPAHPITISVSVSAAAPDHRIHAVPGQSLCSHAQQTSTQAGFQCSSADQLPMEDRGTVQTEEKACQISAEDPIVYLQGADFASPSPESESAHPDPVSAAKVSHNDAGMIRKEPCGIASGSSAERVCMCEVLDPSHLGVELVANIGERCGLRQQ